MDAIFGKNRAAPGGNPTTPQATPQDMIVEGDQKTFMRDVVEASRQLPVLVDFWATWCGPCVEETPNLKETYNAFGNNPRFAMISLSLDQQAKNAADYAKQNNFTWPQGFLGNWSDDKVTKLYNVQGIPSIWLIGPDGKVIAKELRGAQIKEAVEQALGTNARG